MDKPTGPRTLTLEADAPVDDLCDMSKRAYNSARRGKLAYQALVFLMAVALAVAAIYAVVSFSDEEEARGLLGVITSVGSLLVGGFFAALAKSASTDADAMWERVVKFCSND